MKNMILSALILLASIISSASAVAQNKKVLLVSDIDDTIKVSNVLGTAAKFARALDVTTAFTGMPQLYQTIVNENVNSTRIAYVSNAPHDIKGIEVMKYSHSNFLSYNEFPEGELILRLDITDQNHKINTIRKLIKEEKPELVIMVGDNGERDIEIYAQATKELNAQGIETLTYIHQLYSSTSGLLSYIGINLFSEIGKKVLPNQLGYVTPLEIAYDLKNKNLLRKVSYDWLIRTVMRNIINEESSNFDIDILESMTFPSFSNCSDFKWNVKALGVVPTELVPLVSKLNKQCR